MAIITEKGAVLVCTSYQLTALGPSWDYFRIHKCEEQILIYLFTSLFINLNSTATSLRPPLLVGGDHRRYSTYLVRNQWLFEFLFLWSPTCLPILTYDLGPSSANPWDGSDIVLAFTTSTSVFALSCLFEVGWLDIWVTNLTLMKWPVSARHPWQDNITTDKTLWMLKCSFWLFGTKKKKKNSSQDLSALTRWNEPERSSCRSSWSGAPAPQWREACRSKGGFLSAPPPGLF